MSWAFANPWMPIWLSFSLGWRERRSREEGELFLANPAVKNYQINRNMFLLDDHKVPWRRSG